jgi:hypothetical protein
MICDDTREMQRITNSYEHVQLVAAFVGKWLLFAIILRKMLLLF